MAPHDSELFSDPLGTLLQQSEINGSKCLRYKNSYGHGWIYVCMHGWMNE
jgi:hypothetical protein